MAEPQPRGQTLTIKTTVLTSIMAPYRIPVFNALASFPDIDLSVIYLARSEPHRQWPTYETEMQYPFSVLPDRVVFRRNRSWSHLSKGLLAALRSAQADVVIAGGWDQPSHLIAYAMRKRLGYGFIWWVESTPSDQRGPGRQLTWAMKKRLVAGADAVVVPGSASHRYVTALGADGDRVVITVNAVDNELYGSASVRTESHRSGPLTYLTVARLDPEKGLAQLLSAWKTLSDSDTELRIVGTGPLEGELRKQIAEQGIQNVHLIGHLDRLQLLEEYRRADVLVLPSLSEPWGLVVNEAMAAGVPVISSTAVGSAEDLIAGQGTGFLFKAGDERGLADALTGAHELGRGGLSELGAKARSLIQGFSPERSAEGLLAAVQLVHASAR